MPRKIIAAAVLTVLAAGIAMTAHSKYVRKQLQPDFFMPEKVKFNQPEKLPTLPKKEEISKQAEKEPEAAVPAEDKKTERKQVSFVPSYQQKFDDYNHDIDYISRSGEIPVNAALTADLTAMNSNSRFRVEAKPYQESEVSRAFDKALAEVVK